MKTYLIIDQILMGEGPSLMEDGLFFCVQAEEKAKKNKDFREFCLGQKINSSRFRVRGRIFSGTYGIIKGTRK